MVDIEKEIFTMFGKMYFKKDEKMKDNNSICSNCGQDLDVPEGWHYCPECDTESYFVGDKD